LIERIVIVRVIKMKTRRRINLAITHEAFIMYHYIRNKLCVNVSDLISKIFEENTKIIVDESGIYITINPLTIKVDNECLRTIRVDNR